MGELEAQSADKGANNVDHHREDKRALAQHHDKSMRATQLPEELMSSVLVFLRMRDLLGWRLVATSTKTMWATENHVSHVARRLSADLYNTRDKLKAITLLAPGPSLGGTKPVANRDLPRSKWKKCLNIGHKGAHGHVEGNTMASFHKAVQMGVDMIEFDVLTTQDRVVVCHHDPLIEDTGEWIENLTLSQTRKRLKNHAVPTLEDMLRDQTLLQSGVHLYVDMKHTEIVRAVLAAVKQAVDGWGWTADRFVIAGFRQLDLLQVNAHRQAFPELAKLRTACITDGFPLTLARDFEALKVDALSTGKDHVSPDLVADCQRRGIQVWAWTVNNVHFMKRLMKMGVDGICTDYPELVHEANKKFRPQQQHHQQVKASGGRSAAAGSSAPASAPASFISPVEEEPLEADKLHGPATAPTSSHSVTTSDNMNDAGGEDQSDIPAAASTATIGIPMPTALLASCDMDTQALGGWYERSPSQHCHRKCPRKAEGDRAGEEDTVGGGCGRDPPATQYSDEERLWIAVYGDLSGVRDFSVAAVHEAKVFLKACSGAAAVEAFMSRQHITSQTVPRELEGVALLCEEAETEAQQALRPVVSSAETFQWSVDLISTKEGGEFLANLQKSMARDDEPQPMLSFEKAFVSDLFGMVPC